MKFSAVTLVAVAAVASAQSIADIPACAQTCLLPALQATGCQLTDFKCSCSNEQFVSGSTACILKACSKADAEKAAAATYGLCKSAGVTIHTEPIPDTGATSSAAAPPSSSAAAPATSSAAAAPVSSSAAAAPSSSAAAAPTYGAAPTSSAAVHTSSAASYAAPSTIHTTTSCTTKAGNATAPTQAPPVQTGAGVVVVANAVLALGGAVAAFFL
ncbi:hypothetical protein TWF694_004124 [Orbilia ellipsospora]|uniref:CFEM domain-containing protein n=1 Tax=Orbilia ellipsospora TaxID=2528407 RepID=A0AAV9WWZ1_9PEZI